VKRLFLPRLLIAALASVVLLSIVNVPIVQADSVIHHVAVGGDCGGVSPCYSTIQEAVNASTNHDEIRVAQGTYSDVSTAKGITAVVWIVNKKLTITGGYAIADWSTSDPAANPTVIDPRQSGVGIYINYQADIGIGEVVIDGFSITGGNATKSGAGTDSGGGLFIEHTTHVRVTVRNSKIYANVAEDGSGGGIWNFHSDNMKVVDCEIYDNQGHGVATSGSDNTAVINNTVRNNVGYGIAVFTDYGGRTEIRGNRVFGHPNSGIRLNSVKGGSVTDNVVTDNQTGGGGGGLDLSISAVVVSNNVIRNNSAEIQGGGINCGPNNAIKNNLIESNAATLAIGNGGGGLYVDAGSGGSVLVADNQVIANTTPSKGGGMMVLGDVDVTGNTITDNVAGGAGGGIVASAKGRISENDVHGNRAKLGGGIDVAASFGLLLERNHVFDNRAANGDGGGIRLYGSFFMDVALDGNQVISNTASAKGGGIYMECPKDADPLAIANTVLAGNVAAAGSGLFSTGCKADLAYSTVSGNRGSWGDGVGLYFRDPLSGAGPYNIENSIVVKQTTGIVAETGKAVLEATFWGSGPWVNDADSGGAGTVEPGTIVYHGDPAFVDPTHHDYHIAEASPVRNKGADTWTSIDMDGQTRPKGATDIGADEFLAERTVYLPFVTR
jgi:parallel beta-helix repeat protein